MTSAEAKQLLLLHSGAHPDTNHSKSQSGFLGSLRPYGGCLLAENFHEVMAALKVLAPQLEGPLVDREVASALWGICHLGRAWGVEPDGMLRSNRLISDADIARLESWIECISYATMVLLDGGGIEEAFHEYDHTAWDGRH